MKAKLYTIENRQEILVSNKSYQSLENETPKAFKARVQKLLEVDFDEAIEIVEITLESLIALNDNMIVEAYKVSKGLQEEIIKEILTVRGIEVEKIVKAARVKIEARKVEEMKASPEYIEAKANVGKLAEFKPAKSETSLSGVVKSISLNKTNTIIYYNIMVNDNLKCCTSKNPTLVFFEF